MLASQLVRLKAVIMDMPFSMVLAVLSTWRSTMMPTGTNFGVPIQLSDLWALILCSHHALAPIEKCT